MLQLLQKLKLYAELGPETVHKAPISIHIKIYLSSFVDYQHLQKYFYNWYITLNTASSVKSISEVTLSGNAPSNIQCPYFNTIISPILKNCKWLKKFYAGKTNDHVL